VAASVSCPVDRRSGGLQGSTRVPQILQAAMIESAMANLSVCCDKQTGLLLSGNLSKVFRQVLP
jgi:hypothetical protein